MGLRLVILSLLTLLKCGYVKAEQTNLTPRAINYQTIRIEPGEYELYIPISTSFQLDYIQKKVYLKKAFEIGKYEVSNAQWNACFKAGGCAHLALLEQGEGADYPVARVNWHDAFQFSVWLSKVSGKRYRLPTEEEWTYAVQAGNPHKAVEVTYDYSQLNKFIKRTEPRGSYLENEWGLADALGNVWEWTLTCWFASKENILQERNADQLNSPDACFTRIALGENRSHIPDFIADTYSGGCATLRPAANLGFRLVKEL